MLCRARCIKEAESLLLLRCHFCGHIFSGALLQLSWTGREKKFPEKIDDEVCSL